MEEGTLGVLFNTTFLNPYALFGLEGLDRWSHSLFWGLFLNISLYVLVSIFTKQSYEETRQTIIYVDAYDPHDLGFSETPKSISETENTLIQYIGRPDASVFINNFMERNSLTRESMEDSSLIKLRGEAEILLAGRLSPSISSLIFQDRTILTPEEKLQLSDSVKKISSSLRFSRQELAEKNRQLALLKEFSENIIASIPLGIAVLNETLHVRYWNDAMRSITGVTENNALGVKVTHLLKCMEIDLFQPEIREGEVICQRTLGKEPGMTLKVHLSKLTGNQRGYVLVLENITEKQKIEEELFRTNKHASIGRLAAGVAHEIGNPLASISSLVQEITAEETLPFVTESLFTINRHIDRIARIVRNLGDFARLNPRQKISTDLQDILENTINLIRYDKNFRKIELSTDIREIPKLTIDPDQMQQVFLNLMLNARDAMPDGGSITILIREKKGFIEIIISDSGEGINTENQDKLFDPFFTTKGPAKGTGLGLSICYSIIKDHGGTIDVNSEKGVGTSFTIRLPLKTLV
ncbi:PAS domain S-box protein [bacterium]|nr:PAS domain S-box protein [bacterium]